MARRILFLCFLVTGFLLCCHTRLLAQTEPPVFQPLPDSLSRLIDSLLAETTQYRVVLPDSGGVDSATIMVIDGKETDTIKVAGTKTKSSSYHISGIVRDKSTSEGIPFATVFFPGTPVGTAADLDGNFTLTVSVLPSDTLSFQAIGYELASRKLDKSKNKYEFFIELNRSENKLDEFVFKYEDPAAVLMRHIIAHKPVNNPDKTDNYKYEIYNKLEIDLENLTKQQFEKLPIPFMKEFSFIYDNLDTVSESKPFLPLFFTESLSDYYFQRKPRKTKEFIKASQVRGFKNESITEFMGGMYQSLNAYDNYIPVFDKQFISPISSNALFYYKYKIKDTQTAYGYNIVLVQFQPKRPGENCFYGDFWVVDSVYALQRITMEIPKAANINWVNRVSLYQEFGPLEDSSWFPVKDKFVVNFSLPYKINFPGFIGRKTATYRDVVVNDSSVARVVNDPKLKQDVIVADTARQVSDEVWLGLRHDTLSKNERAIYHMVDTLQKMPVFTRYKKMIKFFVSGRLDVGKFEIGPVWNTYSNNPFEGHRFRFSAATTKDIFKDVKLYGYLAYGTKDQAFKYHGEALWVMNREPRMTLQASHTRDLDRSTSYYDDVKNDNLFANVFRKRGIPWKLSFTEDTRIEFFKEYFSGLSHTVSFIHKDFDPFAPLPDEAIFTDASGLPSHHAVNSEINVKFRYAYKEKFLEGPYKRLSLGSKYPIAEIRYGMGLKDVFNSGYRYHKVSLNISDDVKIPPLGKFYFNVFAGKYFGTLPYALLEIHPGNEFHYYNRYAFNMMNRFEFISDQYAGINMEHSLGGGIFTYIPVLKLLKLRQYWSARVLYGDISEENRALNLNKGYIFRTLDKVPYVEVGTGIANILEIFAIDFVWRLSPELLPGESNDKYFGVFGSMRIDF